MAHPSVDELVDALRAALEKNPGPSDARTTREWCKMLGLADKAVRKRLTQLIEDGKVGRVKVPRVSPLSGVEQMVDAYRLL